MWKAFCFIIVRTLTLRSAVLTHIKCAAQYCGPQGCGTRGLWKLQFTDLKLPSWIRNPPPALFRVMTFMAFVGNCSTVSDDVNPKGDVCGPASSAWLQWVSDPRFGDCGEGGALVDGERRAGLG